MQNSQRQRGSKDSTFPKAERQRGREAERQRDRETERQRDREAKRQRGREVQLFKRASFQW